MLAPANLCAQVSGDLDEPAPATGPPVAVHGTVINAATGAALPRALVQIDSSEVLAALTADDGSFTIDGVPSGAHTIAVRRPGFRPFREEGEEAASAAHGIVAAAGNPPLTLSLSPLNAIRVHLTLTTGIPASTIGIALFAQSVANGRRSWVETADRQTDPSGQVRFSGLSDGAYLLATRPEYGNVHARDPECGPAAPPTMPGYASIFLPSSADSSGAAPIHVSGGQTADAAFALAPGNFYLVRIAVAHAPAADGWNFSVSLFSRSGELMPYAFHQEKDHSLCGYLPEGAYTASVEASRDTVDLPAGNASPAPATTLFGTLDFTVDGAALPGLRLSLAQAAAAPIHLHYEPGPPVQTKSSSEDEDAEEEGDPLEVTATAAYSVQPRGVVAPEATATGDATYALGPMAPGSYWIHADTGQNGVCLGTVTAGGEDLATAPWIAGSSGSGPPVDAVLRTDCAKLKVILPPGSSGENAGDDSTLFLYAVPLFPSLQDAATAQIQPLSRPTAELEDLTPGAYRVFLFRSPRSPAFREPGGLEALGPGQDIMLEPGEDHTLTLTGPAQ